jgi:hypothetical protein
VSNHPTAGSPRAVGNHPTAGSPRAVGNQPAPGSSRAAGNQAADILLEDRHPLDTLIGDNNPGCIVRGVIGCNRHLILPYFIIDVGLYEEIMFETEIIIYKKRHSL